jgi:hypothetical protein
LTSVDVLGHAADVWGQGVASSNLASPTIPQQRESGSDLRKHDRGPSRSTTREGSLCALSQGLSQTERRALLIAVYGLLAPAAGRLGVAGLSLAMVGTMLLGVTCGSNHLPSRGWPVGRG